MTKRNPTAVLLLPFITFFLYQIYWYFVTGKDMKAKGAEVPSIILFFIPIANLVYLWKWSKAADLVTNGKMPAGLAFILNLYLGPIGNSILQSTFNDII